MEHCCKVEKVIEKYGLRHNVTGGDLDEYLIARWKGKNEYPETGLRPLTDWFNQKILKTVYSEHGRSALETRLESDYNALTNDNDEQKIEILEDLDADGIDGEELVGDFISTSTLYRHFTSCLDKEKPQAGDDDQSGAESAMNRIQFARHNSKTHIRKGLTTLENRDVIKHASEANIRVPIILECPVCATQVQLEHAVDQGYICGDHMTESEFDLADVKESEEDNGTVPEQIGQLDNLA